MHILLFSSIGCEGGMQHILLSPPLGVREACSTDSSSPSLRCEGGMQHRQPLPTPRCEGGMQHRQPGYHGEKRGMCREWVPYHTTMVGREY